MNSFHTGREGYQFCEQYDNGTYIYYLYSHKSGSAYILRQLKSEPTTIVFSKTINNINAIWDFSSHQPKSTGYYYWHDVNLNNKN